MAQFSDLSVAIRVQITNLFTATNFCFYTASNTRSPTFYFAQGGLAQLNAANLCGRIRTMHNRGALIDITNSSKGHLFFEQLADREAVRRAMSDASNVNLPHRSRRYMMNLVEQIHRTEPRNWDYHYEYTKVAGQPDRITRRHASGGRIHLRPRPSQDQVRRLIDRVLADECAVKINNGTVKALGVAAPRAAVTSINDYLNSL